MRYNASFAMAAMALVGCGDPMDITGTYTGNLETTQNFHCVSSGNYSGSASSVLSLISMQDGTYKLDKVYSGALSLLDDGTLSSQQKTKSGNSGTEKLIQVTGTVVDRRLSLTVDTAITYPGGCKDTVREHFVGTRGE